MTAEQEKQVKTAKLNDQRAAYTGAIMSASMRDRRNLITIIDDLQKQQPKRYTEDELRDIVFEKLQRFLPMQFGKMQERMLGWLECARFLGMIKTEGGIMKGSDKDSKEVKE